MLRFLYNFQLKFYILYVHVCVRVRVWACECKSEQVQYKTVIQAKEMLIK